ncbi:UDP-glycosyltransferase 75C1 [Curcuma longa]|uniref:UDP-glycosyltransferase 75C1 n=1 Tax=Curcuma longa TaxID=136217 RepID=UPI003D9EF1D4
MELKRRQHYLVATFPFQGHINPALHLAKHLARAAPGAHVTFSTSLSAHRRMFPSSPDSHSEDLLSYAPYSDGFDDGDTSGVLGFNRYMVEFKASGSRTFSRLIADLAADGRPVTCVIYTMLLPWAADVARDHGIPSVHYWIQPAAIFAIYYHYFHGYGALVDAHREDPSFVVTLPGLPPLQIRDLPSFLTAPDDHPLSSVVGTLREGFAVLDWERNAPSSLRALRPRILVNTFDELEPRAIAAVSEVEILTIGPLIPSWSSSGGDMFKADDKGYGEWLDAKPERSVVYVSFGSLHRCSALELEKLAAGLEATGRPYLWVVRKDDRDQAVGAAMLELEGPRGMVVEWCAQVRVLSHAAVGCFVTHCGWNSTLESLACGVPTVGVPRLSDQLSNAKMAKDEWGTGVTAEIGADGVVAAEELRRCVETVMGEESGEGMRKRAREWKERARAAVSEGGSSDRNLRAFLGI